MAFESTTPTHDFGISPDGVLVADHLSGRAAGFEVLHRRFFPRLTAHCRALGGVDPEDLAQETLTRALERMREFDVKRPLWPWLKVIATNLARDRARRMAREVPLAPESDPPARTNEHARVEDRLVLTTAMSTLTDSQQTALRLRYLEDWDTASAAEFLGISQPALKQLLLRARSRLRAFYEELREGPLAWAGASFASLRRWLEQRVLALRRGALSSPAIGSELGWQLAVGILGLAMVADAGVPSASGLPADSAPRPVEAPAMAQSAWRHLSTGASEGARRALPSEDERGLSAGKEPRRAVDGVVGRLSGQSRENARPEDTRILSIAFAPSSKGATMRAIGAARCGKDFCPPILFLSVDGGRSWSSQKAEGLTGDKLLIPPGPADRRVFAMGAAGLQVSEDGGDSFRPAGVGGGPATAGPAAISPGFNTGDPTILIGAKTLIRYRDNLGSLEPAATTSPPGPFQPAFSPAYMQDAVVFLAGDVLDTTSGANVAAVYRCKDGVCEGAALEAEELPSQVRTSPSAGRANEVYAYTESGLFRSQDAGASFERTPFHVEGELIWDVAISSSGVVHAITIGAGPSAGGGFYSSSSAGASWTRARSPLLKAGAVALSVAGKRVIVGLRDGGVACSADGGITWRRRCVQRSRAHTRPEPTHEPGDDWPILIPAAPVDLVPPSQ